MLNEEQSYTAGAQDLKADYYVSDQAVFCRETYGNFKAVQPIGHCRVHNICFDTNLASPIQCIYIVHVAWFSRQTVIISLTALPHRSLLMKALYVFTVRYKLGS